MLADFTTKRDDTYSIVSRGRKARGIEDAFIEDGTEVRYYDQLGEIRALLEGKFQIVELHELAFQESGHPVSRPFPHTHSSFVVLAKKLTN